MQQSRRDFSVRDIARCHEWHLLQMRLARWWTRSRPNRAKLRFPCGKCSILTGRMQRHPTLSTSHRLLLFAVLAIVIPSGIAHAQLEVANASLPDAAMPQQSTTKTSQPAPPPASTSTSTTAQDQQQKKQTSDEIL